MVLVNTIFYFTSKESCSPNVVGTAIALND